MIRVTGAATNVIVRVTGTGEVLQSGVLNQGEARMYDQPPMDVVATNGGAVDVFIYGKLQPRAAQGARGAWHVPQR
ncbi:RodZ domain-containing protein [Spirillospora sp. CA-294931]|uniref:RodZ domain-containing protein n=1 Tax=Spirillospora sp. CA-294931 TaxID=3240042 RepID=UPI003D8FA458